MSAAKAKAQTIIDDNAVAVFSKSYCPFCKATKQLLSDEGAKPYIIELDQVGMSHLQSRSSYRADNAGQCTAVNSG